MTAYRFTMDPRFVVDKGEGTRICAFPAAAAFPVAAGNETLTRLFVFFSQTKDSAHIPPSVGVRISDDNGKTWPHYQSHEWFPISLVKLADGVIGGPSFVTEMIGEGHSQEQRIRWIESADDGMTWHVTEGKLVTDEPMRCIVKGSGRGGFAFTWVLDMGSGVLGAALYGYYAADAKYRTVWAESADRGRTWHIVSTVAYDPHLGPEGYCEPTVARVADGSLLCVMRVGSNKPLYQCRSADNGRTWSAPVVLPGPAAEQTHSVLPALRLRRDGKLVLSYGRPGTRLLLSPDGNGMEWTSAATTYDGVTTGYTGLAVGTDDRLFLTGDQGADWHFDFKQGFPDPNPFTIWGTWVDIGD